MFCFQNLSNKLVQKSDIKLLAGSKIKLSQSTMDFLKLDSEKQRLFLDLDRNSGKYWIAAMPIVEEDGKVVSAGKPINSKGEFSNQSLHFALRGVGAEWKIEKESEVEFEGVLYYSIAMEKDGDEFTETKSTETVNKTIVVNATEIVSEIEEVDELPEDAEAVDSVEIVD